MKKPLIIQWYKWCLTFITLAVVFSCKNLTPRKPVMNNSGSAIQTMVETNKKIYAAEETAILAAIKESGEDFIRSGNGFWYRFTTKNEGSGPTPKFGDRVTFEYNVIALDGEVIYDKDEVSPLTKSMEQEYGIFKGMREGLKLMQAGESAVFYFPSYMGYGYYGDENKIGTNVPFKSEVILISINKN